MNLETAVLFHRLEAEMRDQALQEEVAAGTLPPVDYGYTWQTPRETAGQTHSVQAVERKERLKQLAETVQRFEKFDGELVILDGVNERYGRLVPDPCASTLIAIPTEHV